MDIIVKKVGKNPQVIKIPSDVNGSLKALQDIVGGYIEIIPVKKCMLVCNGEGKIRGLRPNIIYNNDVIVGDIAFVSHKGEDICGLSDEQIKYVIHKWTSSYRN